MMVTIQDALEITEPDSPHEALVQAVARRLASEGPTAAIMDRRPKAPCCSFCGQYVDGCSEEAESVICPTCMQFRAQSYDPAAVSKAVQHRMTCPLCGGEKPPTYECCNACWAWVKGKGLTIAAARGKRMQRPRIEDGAAYLRRVEAAERREARKAEAARKRTNMLARRRRRVVRKRAVTA